MIQLSDIDSKRICKKFIEQHEWDIATYENHTKLGISPLIVIKKENNSPVIHLYDGYIDLIVDIKNEVEKELNMTGGYSDSYYLSLEDIDVLDLHKYVTTDRDVEKVLSDAKNVIEN